MDFFFHTNSKTILVHENEKVCFIFHEAKSIIYNSNVGIFFLGLGDGRLGES